MLIILLTVWLIVIPVVNKSVYKIDNIDIVEKYALEYNLDAYFLLAVIKTESDFNENAVSNVGARGLMQIMPDTFSWINSKLKDDTVNYDDMFIAEQNIRFGGYLYSELFKEFKNYQSAIAGYHAGRGAVNKWLNDEQYSSDNVTLDVIPISATEHYVEKVMTNYEQYKKIYC